MDEESSLKFTKDCLKIYSEDDINQLILPFKQRQLRELKAEAQSLKVAIMSLVFRSEGSQVQGP